MDLVASGPHCNSFLQDCVVEAAFSRVYPPKFKQGMLPSSSPTMWGWQRLLVIYLGLAALVLAVFGQTRWFDFVNYDDGSYVFENPIIRAGLTWHGLVWAFTHIHAQNWHPLTSI